MAKSILVGLTGGIGSGKSLVAKHFRDLGANVIDADEIGRQLLIPENPVFSAVIEHFGTAILQKDGSIDRARLRSIIFENPNERDWLEKQLHPLIKIEILNRASALPAGHYAVIEIPLLFEANFQDLVHRILVVDCEEALQIERVANRDGVPLDIIKAIIATQASRTTRLTKANDIIHNSSSREALKQKVQDLHKYYSSLTK